jgi:hypothetical protein
MNKSVRENDPGHKKSRFKEIIDLRQEEFEEMVDAESLEQLQEEDNDMFEGSQEPLTAEDRVDWFDETTLRAEEQRRR